MELPPFRTGEFFAGVLDQRVFAKRRLRSKPARCTRRTRPLCISDGDIYNAQGGGFARRTHRYEVKPCFKHAGRF